MRKATVLAMVVLMGIVLTPVAMAGETVTKIDASDGASTGHWVCFVSKPTATNSTKGTLGAAVGKGDSFEGAFGLFVEGGKTKISRLTHETLKEARESDKAPDTLTIIIQVTEEQFTKAKAIIDRYSAMKEYLDSPTNTVLNSSGEVLSALGLRLPYRSGLSTPNPFVWHSDITIKNRKLIQE